MPSYTINTPFTTAFSLASGDRLTVTRFGSVEIATAPPPAAINGPGSDVLSIEGVVVDSQAAGTGILLGGAANMVAIGTYGLVSAKTGLAMSGTGNQLMIAGQIIGKTARAVESGQSSVVTLLSTARVQGQTDGIYVGAMSTVSNAGQISATTGYGVFILSGPATLINTGVIVGDTEGVGCSGGGTDALTLANSGIIQAVAGSAIGVNGRLILNNTGTIDGAGAIGCITGVDITNAGYIFGRMNTAISGGGASNRVVNNGFIQGAATAVQFYGGADFFDGRNGLQFGAVQGDSGNDTLFGGAGNDYLYGGNDDDQLMGGGAGDYLDGGAGFDYARYDGGGAVTASLATPAANTGDAAGDTYVSIEGLIGSNAGDLLIGDTGANTLFGLGGMDGIAGGDGNDTIYGGDGGDSIAGQAGNDVIYGGAGGDVLSGGAGGDIFAYSSLADGGDLIQDFNAGGVRDSFDIRAIFDASGYTGTTPRVGNILQVLQNGADTDVYVYNTFLFRIPNLYAPALDDTYFTFQ